MRNDKAFASLGSSLLARKGAARPAMRPPSPFAGEPDDLGWNDMGDGPAPQPRRGMMVRLPLTPEPAVLPPEPPVVVRQQEAIAREFAPPAAPVPVAAEPGRKTAFTLRLDADRHFRLRLACAVEHRSAQQIVTRALDALLATMPEADRLAASLPPAARPRRGR